jgi:hypothetical protein
MRFGAHVIAGIEDLNQRLYGADIVATQLSVAPCEGSLTHAIDNEAALTLGQFRGDLRLRGIMAPKAVTLILILEQGQSLTRWGPDTRPHDLLVYPMGGDLEGHCRNSTRYAALKMPLEVLQRSAAAFEHLADDRHWSTETRLRPPRGAAIGPEVGRRLERLLRLGPGLDPQALVGLRDRARALQSSGIETLRPTRSSR